MMHLWRRVSMGVLGAFAIYALNVPVSLAASQAAAAPPTAARPVLQAPDPPAADLAREAASAQAHHGQRAIAFDHVARMDTASILQFEQKTHGRVLESTDGRFVVQSESNGISYLVTFADAVLKSGRAVVGISITKLDSGTRPAQALSAGLASVYAGTTYFLACSYAYQAYPWSDLYVYICPRDVFLLSGALTIIAGAVGGLVGLLMGGPVGAAVGIGVGTALGLTVVVGFWAFMNSDGSVGITIPNWTMQAPFGGWIRYWNWVQAYMSNQCWIYYNNWWYAPYCR